jgi:hypothetical protein
MYTKSYYLISFSFTIFLAVGAAFGGVDYTDPDGGWAYIYNGDQALPDFDAALDGTWDHFDAGSGGSDAWDGSAPGQVGSAGTGSAPGGAGVFTEGDTTFLRIQDCGDPRDAGGWADPSNRKVTFVHDMAQEPGVDGTTILDNGVTISFRARIPTTPPLDDYYPDGGTATQPWVTRGYNIHDDGYGVFSVKQGSAAEGMISFSLCTPDDEGISGTGLVMNKLNGTAVSADVDSYDTAGTEVLFSGFDPTEWHEFWIQIAADTSGGGTHKVTIWMDGNTDTPNGSFYVTAGTKDDDYDLEGYIGMSLGRTAIAGSQDVDFFAYKPGLVPPHASDPYKARAINPVSGTTVSLADATPLAWKEGQNATRHDVYLGTSQQDVNDADTNDTSNIYRGRQNIVLYTPTEALELGKTYYWRIDEVEADGVTIHKGSIWSFSILDYILIDDFENYDSADNQIWYAWHDGLGYGDPASPPFFAGNGTGAAVGDETTSSFTEETIVHGGRRSMPYFYNNNKQGFLNYSEATKTLTKARDWTEEGVKALSLWFRGYPPYLGNFTEAPAGSFTITAEGADIEGASDQFHFAFQSLPSAGSIVVKVLSIQDTDPWAKAGVMIRDTLDPDSAYAMVAVTPGNGIWFGRRTAAGAATASDSQAGLTAPYWLKMERSSGGLMRAYYSADGASWTQLGSSVAINMNIPMYIGFAVTSHSPGVACEAKFSNVTSNGVGPWTDRDIGLTSNQAAPMYIKIANNNGTAGMVYNDDPNATLISTWTEWNIDLKDFANQGVDLTNVDSITIGIGDASSSLPGGSGKMYIDDIRLYKPRYLPDKVEPLLADFNNDGAVDIKDLQIMFNDWLQSDYTTFATTPQPPVSWWKLDNNASDSTSANPGTVRGNPTYTTGKSGQAINLNGDDYIDLGNPASLDFGTGDWTISAWIKTTQAGTEDENKGTIYGKGGDQTDGIRYILAVNEVTSGFITLTTDDNVTKVQATGNTVVNDNVWHHVAGVRNGTQLLVYVDGALDGTGTVPNGYDLSGTTQHNAYIGVITDNRDGTLIKYFIGLIDDVQIYNYALSDTDILSVAGLTEMYHPVNSPANISNDEPANSRSVNFKDFAVLADEWLQQLLWPN